jgi:hypothetical protein
MTSDDPLKALFDLCDKIIWIAHPTHGPFYDERTWLYYEVKEPIHRWAYRLGLTKDKPVTLYTPKDIIELLGL